MGGEGSPHHCSAGSVMLRQFGFVFVLIFGWLLEKKGKIGICFWRSGWLFGKNKSTGPVTLFACGGHLLK